MANRGSADRRQATCPANPVQWRRPWRGTNISCAVSRLSATREKSSRGIVREDRADHEQSRASADDRERNPIDLAIKCDADDAHTAASKRRPNEANLMRFDVCPRGHIARRSNKNWQNIMEPARGNVREFA